jgi:nucleotide-binding universal stress UspA family protein
VAAAPARRERGVIVVGVDRSPEAGAALRWAVDEAARRGTTVRAVFAWQRPLPTGWRAIPPELLTTGALTGAAETILEAAVDRALAGLDAQVERAAIEGRPVETLVAASRDAELLVVGTKRHHAPTGSTTSGCMAHARRPVVAVHDEELHRRHGAAALFELMLRHRVPQRELVS